MSCKFVSGGRALLDSDIWADSLCRLWHHALHAGLVKRTVVKTAHKLLQILGPFCDGPIPIFLILRGRGVTTAGIMQSCNERLVMHFLNRSSSFEYHDVYNY